MAVLLIMTVLPFESGAAENMVLNVTLNGAPKGDQFILRADDGDILFRSADLEAIGLRDLQGAATVIDGVAHLSLRSLRDITFIYDDRKLTLTITAPPHLLAPSKVDLHRKPLQPLRPRENSLFLNYGLNYSRTDPADLRSFTATGTLGARSGDLLFLTDGLHTENDLRTETVRLMSAITYERRDDFQWFILGDAIADSGRLGSTLNMGGVSVSKVYRLDPNFIKYPMFDYSGIAAMPSQAEIYLDGILVDRRQIAPGPYELKNLNYYGGARSIEVRLKDAMGREQRLALPAYFTDQTLRKGLHEYSYHAGYLREEYGTRSNEYGELAFSAYHRYGASNEVNIGARAEASDGLYNAGINVSYVLPQAGTLTGLVAESAVRGLTGAAGSIQHVYQRGRFVMRENITRYAEGYRTINTLSIPNPVKQEVGASVGYGTRSLGNISLTYVGSSSFTNTRRNVYSLGYTKELMRATTLLVTMRSLRETDSEYEVMAGLQYLFGQNRQVMANVQKTGTSNTETIRVQQNLPIGEGAGYQVSLARSESGGPTTYSLNPHVQYNARFGTYSAGAFLQDNGRETLRTASASAAGALVLAGGYFGLARPVSDSFSIVVADNLPDVPVLLNNVEVTRTDAGGKAVVPTVASYGTNRISVAMDNVPLQQSIEGVAVSMAPSQWSGSCVSFEAASMQAITGMVVLVLDGQRVPLEHVHAVLTVEDQTVPFLTGAGGEFYLENVIADTGRAAAGADWGSCRSIRERQLRGRKVIKPGMYPLTIEHQGLQCSIMLTFPMTDDLMTDLGDVLCFPLPK